jgi:LysM repeat protein
LISIIESANLQRFDDFAEGQYEVEGPYSSLVSENGNSPLSDSTNNAPPEASTSYPDLRENDGVFLLNRIQAVGYRGEDLDSLAALLDLSILQLSKYNDLLAGESIPLGSPIYRQPKKKKGLEKTVTVQPGDNMWLISQWQGIRLTRLYLLNNMIPGEEPAVGEVLHLRKPSESKPTLRDKSEDNAETSQATEVRVEEEEGDTEANLEEVASQNVEIDTEIDREIDSEINEEKDAEVLEDSETVEHVVDISDDGSSEEGLFDISSAPQVEVEVDGGQLSTFSEDESFPELVDGVETDVAEEDTEVTEPVEKNPVNEENIAPDANQVPAETALSEPAPEVIETRERSFHTVSEGETLFSIARLYDLTLMNLKQWNALDGVSIEVGQKLFVEPR